MKYLLDTCVLSELVRPRPDPGLMEWVEGADEEALYVSVLTLGELQQGIVRLPDSARRKRLAGWVSKDLRARFAGRTLAVTAEVAERWGALQGAAEAKGRRLPVIDSLLAATALTEGLVVVTRNTADLRSTGAEVLSPWRG